MLLWPTYYLPWRLRRRFLSWQIFIGRYIVSLMLLFALLNFLAFYMTSWNCSYKTYEYPTSSSTREAAENLKVKGRPMRGGASPNGSLLGRRFESFPQLAPQPSQFASGFSHMDWSEARKEFERLLDQNVGSVNQTSRSFKDIQTYKHHGILLPAVTPKGRANQVWQPGAMPHPSEMLEDYYRREELLAEYDINTYVSLQQSVGSAEFCNPADANYTPSKDLACIAYLRNPANWLALKPMSSKLTYGRTLKMLLSFRHGNLTAVVKFPSGLFPLEASNEVAAFHMDRFLGFRRVPPAVLVAFPVEYIKAAAATLGAFYSHWVKKEVLSSKYSKRVTRRCNNEQLAIALSEKNPTCILVSLQLWMWGVDPVENSIFRDAMKHLPGVDAECKGRLESKTGILDAGGNKSYMDRCGDRRRSISFSSPAAAAAAAALQLLASREYWDQLAFDTIIGNRDRWLGHNTFVIGACDPSLPCHASRMKRLEERPTKSEPRLVYIDQGSGFYYTEVWNRSVFFPQYQPRYCRVNRGTAERLERITAYALNMNEGNINMDAVQSEEEEQLVAVGGVNGSSAVKWVSAKQIGDAIYQHLMLPRLPAMIWAILPRSHMKHACRRLWYVLAHRGRCLESDGNNVFL